MADIPGRLHGSGGVNAGAIVKITSDHFLPVDCQYGLARVDGFMIPVELVATEGVDRARARLEKGGRMDDVKDEDGLEDVRANWIDWDSRKKRYKDWRSVTQESHTERFGDWPLEGPPCAMDLAVIQERVGGNPQLWLDKWASKKGFNSGDMAIHDLKCLTDARYYFGSYDQPNLGTSVGIEIISRRVQSYVDAYAVNPQRPNWGLTKYY